MTRPVCSGRRRSAAGSHVPPRADRDRPRRPTPLPDDPIVDVDRDRRRGLQLASQADPSSSRRPCPPPRRHHRRANTSTTPACLAAPGAVDIMMRMGWPASGPVDLAAMRTHVGDDPVIEAGFRIGHRRGLPCVPRRRKPLLMQLSHGWPVPLELGRNARRCSTQQRLGAGCQVSTAGRRYGRTTCHAPGDHHDAVTTAHRDPRLRRSKAPAARPSEPVYDQGLAFDVATMPIAARSSSSSATDRSEPASSPRRVRAPPDRARPRRAARPVAGAPARSPPPRARGHPRGDAGPFRRRSNV